MQVHTGIKAHDGFAPHSHEVRPDHLGVARSEASIMNDHEKVEALEKILSKHDDNINDPDGGERPFNESGEVIEALWFLVNRHANYEPHNEP